MKSPNAIGQLILDLYPAKPPWPMPTLSLQISQGTNYQPDRLEFTINWQATKIANGTINRDGSIRGIFINKAAPYMIMHQIMPILMKYGANP